MRNEENVFVANEEKQLCRSLFHMSKRFSYNNLEKKNIHFWNQLLTIITQIGLIVENIQLRA